MSSDRAADSDKPGLPEPATAAAYDEKKRRRSSFGISRNGSLQRLLPRNSNVGWIAAFILLLLFWKDSLFRSYEYLQTVEWREDTTVDIDDEPPNPILNSTLGFQKIFTLSLPERADRREPLLDGANATNLTITIIDGIKDRQIPETQKPAGWSTNGWIAKEGELGCLMSHYRTWQKMIHENISSAIIMESDVDWDMRIKQAMVGVGRASKNLADWPFDPEPSDEELAALHANKTAMALKKAERPQVAPYGNKWDLLWIGHCGSSADGDPRKYAYNDSSAPDEDHAWSFGGRPMPGFRNNGQRVVYKMKSSVCTTGYAISLGGARKFEALFREANSPIDIKMWDACANKQDFVCLGVWPQIISMTESRGNIKHTGGGLSFGKHITVERVVAGKSVQISSRVNGHMGTGHQGPDGWIREWPDGELPVERMRREKEIEESMA